MIFQLILNRTVVGEEVGPKAAEAGDERKGLIHLHGLPLVQQKAMKIVAEVVVSGNQVLQFKEKAEAGHATAFQTPDGVLHGLDKDLLAQRGELGVMSLQGEKFQLHTRKHCSKLRVIQHSGKWFSSSWLENCKQSLDRY